MVLRKEAETTSSLALREAAPALPGRGQVRIKVHATGVCGTDLHIADGSYPSRPPVTLGHEIAGVVDLVGTGGDMAFERAEVTCETFFSTCGTCDRCAEGRPNLCLYRLSIGSGVDGGFAQYVIVPQQSLHRLPARVGTTLGALSEPLACVCQSLLDPSRVAPGDRVLVTGPGTIGLLAAQLARALGGVVTVVGTASDEVRLGAASGLGFSTAISGADDVGTFDVAIECSGAGPAMAMALESLRPGGRYVQMGQTGRSVTVPLALVSFKELEISGGFASTPRSWRRAMYLLSSDRIELAPLITETAPLAEWERIFAATASGQGIKYLLAPDDAK